MGTTGGERTPLKILVHELRQKLIPAIASQLDPSLRDDLRALVQDLNPDQQGADRDGEVQTLWRHTWAALNYQDRVDELIALIRALKQVVPDEEERRKLKPNTNPKALYMPVDWFKDEFGLTAESLRGQARRGNLATMKRGHWNLYSVLNAMTIWPQLVTYGPNESK